MDVEECARALLEKLERLIGSGVSIQNWQFVTRVFASAGGRMLAAVERGGGPGDVDSGAWWSAWRLLTSPRVESADDLISALQSSDLGSSLFAECVPNEELCPGNEGPPGEEALRPCADTWACWLKYLDIGWDFKYGVCKRNTVGCTICVCEEEVVPWVGLLILLALAIVAGPVAGRTAIQVARWVVTNLGTPIPIPIG